MNILSQKTISAEMRQDEVPASKIHLTFDKKLRNLKKEFVFRSDLLKCDVLLDEWDTEFSYQYFHIMFNAEEEVILKNTSQVKTCVNYKGEELSDWNYFIWILFNKYKNIDVMLNKIKEK